MEQVGDMKFIDFEDALDRDLGKVGTPKRNAFESRVDEAVYSYKLGEAIRKARLEQNLTQEELGERIGVKKAQISKLERGYSITISTMSRVFKALGFSTASLELGGSLGKVALW
jgi:ribosome-binding protein aMBF1 (putative translation factor)